MSEYAEAIDVSASSELLQLVERLQRARQPIPLTRDNEIVAVVQPVPARTRAPRQRPARTRSPHYPTLESLAGAAGTLSEPRPWKEVLAEAREDHLTKKLPASHA